MPVRLQAGLWGLFSGGALLIGAVVGYRVELSNRRIAGIMAFGGGGGHPRDDRGHDAPRSVRRNAQSFGTHHRGRVSLCFRALHDGVLLTPALPG